MKRFLLQPHILSLLSGIFILFFLVWITLTYMPVLWVETKYQYRHFLNERLHITSLRELFIPDFKMLGFRGKSDHREYGIVIPEIYLDEPVVFNVDPNDKAAYTSALKKGIAHASGTTFPDNPGVGYYFAHSSSAEFRQQYNAVFYLLGKLEKGDEVFIWHEGHYTPYAVSKTKITEPGDVSFLQPEEGKETIVLQTCWPPGTTQKRLLVFAERVEE